MDGKATISTNLATITARYGKQRKEVKRYFERRRNRELKKSAAMRDDQLFLFADETNKAITNGASDSKSSNSTNNSIAAVDNTVTAVCTTTSDNMLLHKQTQLHEQCQEKKSRQNVQNTSKAQTNNVEEELLESAPTQKVNTITTTIINKTSTIENTESKVMENSISSSNSNTTTITKTKKTKKKKSKTTKANGSLENKAITVPYKGDAVKLIDNKTSNNDDNIGTNNYNDSVSKPVLPSHNKYMIDKQLICYHNQQSNTISNSTNANMQHAESRIQEKPCTTAVNNLYEQEEESSACMTVATCPQECERACCSFTKSKSSPNSASPKPALISILPILEAMHNAHCGKTSKCTSTKACSTSAQCASTHVKENNKPASLSSSARSTTIIPSSPTAVECNTKGKCITPTNSISSGGDTNKDECKSENATGSSLLTSSSSFSSSSSSSSSSNSGLQNFSVETPTFTSNNNNIIIASTTERSDVESKRDIIEKKYSTSSCSSESSSLLVSRSKSKSSSPIRIINIDGSATHATRLQENKLYKTQEKDEHTEYTDNNNNNYISSGNSSNKYNSSSPCIVTSMVRRLDQVPPLPITRPLSSGTSLNVPTRNYLLLDREYNLHQFAPGFKRNDELALESLLETASLEWHKIQKHSCEALLDSSTNVECDMCNRMNNSFVITTANAMKALFQVGYMAHKKLALKVIRIGPDIVIDTCAASCYGDHNSVYDLRRQALIGKALYRLREESSKVFDHEEEEEEEVHHDKETKHQVNPNSSNNNNINSNKETKTTQVNTCRDIIPLSRQASLNFLENNHIHDNKMNTPMNMNGAIRANPLSSALVAHKREYSRFSQVMYWNIDALELLVGVDVPIILDVRTNTEHLLRLMDEADDEENALHSEQLYCDALNCWFDATIANVPEVGVYIHNAGVVQRFELKKVNELLSRVQGKVAAMSMNFTSNVLQWIVSQCVEDKATYIVVRGDESAYLKMYKIPAEEVNNTNYCSNSDNTASSTNNCTTTTPTSTEKSTKNNTKNEQEMHEIYVNTEKESMKIKYDNVYELEHSQTKEHYGQEDMACVLNRQYEPAFGPDGVRLISKTENNEESHFNNKLKTVSAVHAKENECELDKMSGVVCLYNNKKETFVYTPNVQGEVVCITNKNEEEERQREEKKKCLDAEEAHKERLSVSLAQMCYAMGVHLHSEADKRKANEAIGLLRRTFLIHVRRIHDSRAREMVMDVVQRLPSLIGLMLSTMWSENETTTSNTNNKNVEGEDDKTSLANKSGNTNKGNSYKKDETKEISLHQCDMEIKPFDRHINPWATWTCVEALKLCVQFQEPLLHAIRQTEKCTLSFTFYATCLIECSAALSVLVARTLEAFCAERKCIFAAEFAAAKETRWKRQRKQKQEQQGNCKNVHLQPLQNAMVVNDNKTPVRGEDALRPFLATIVEGLVLLEHVNHTIEELSHSANTTTTTEDVNSTNKATIQECNRNNNNENISSGTHEMNVREVKEHVQDAKEVNKFEDETKMKSNNNNNNKDMVESSWNIELAPLRAALCELYGDLILLTMADPTTFTPLILKRIATEMSVQLESCSWNTNLNGITTTTNTNNNNNNNANINMTNKTNPITSKNTTLQWLRCISSDAVSLSFTALRFYTKSSTTAQRQLLKMGQVHYFVGQFHHRVDRYTKSLEALHRAKSTFALAAKTNKVPPFGECFCSSSMVTVEDVMQALGDVYADLAELKEDVALNMFTGQNKCISSSGNNNNNSSMCIVYTIYTNACHTNVINNTLSSNAYVALQPILFGPLHVMCEEEENFIRRAINAYTSSACLSAKAHVLIKYANAQIGNLALRSSSANAMKLVAIDKTESKHIYYLLQEAKNVNVSVLEWQRQWELMRLLEVTKTGECEDHLFAEIEEIVKEWVNVYLLTWSSQHEEMLLSENNVCSNDMKVNEMSRNTPIEKVYSPIQKKNTEKQQMEPKTIELDHITVIEQTLQLSVTCIRIAEEYKYNLQTKRLSSKYNNVEDARTKLREMQERHQRTRCVYWAWQALCVLAKLLDDVLDINHNKKENTRKVIEEAEEEEEEEEEEEVSQREQQDYNNNTCNKENETNTKENSALTAINANIVDKNLTMLLSPWMRAWRFAFSTVNTNNNNNNNNMDSKNVTCHGVSNGPVSKMQEKNKELLPEAIVNQSNSNNIQMTCTNTTSIANVESNYKSNNNNNNNNDFNDALCSDLQQWCYFVCVIVCRMLQCINDDTLDTSGNVKITDNSSPQNNNHSHSDNNNNNTSTITVMMKNTKRLDALAEVVQELLTRHENMTQLKEIELLCTLRTQLKKLS